MLLSGMILLDKVLSM